MSKVVEMEAFRLRREIGIRRGKSVASKIVAAAMIENMNNAINPPLGGLMFDQVWMDELRFSTAEAERAAALKRSKVVAARQNREVEIERQKHEELVAHLNKTVSPPSVFFPKPGVTDE